MLRQIIIPNKNIYLLHLPDEFVGQKVEVIAFTVNIPESDDGSHTTKIYNRQGQWLRLKKFISKNPIKLPKGYKFNRDELYE